ncbi:hypothetical protein BHM03_00040432 [Ensete ventricosum]|nr:hypothetical protein BHM03_00040432 [Ensete ventricosum]
MGKRSAFILGGASASARHLMWKVECFFAIRSLNRSQKSSTFVKLEQQYHAFISRRTKDARNMKGEEKEGYRIFGTSRLFHDRTLRSNREGPSATIGMATG